MTQPQSPLDGDDFETIARLNKWLDQAAYLYSAQEGKGGNDDGGRLGVRLSLHAALELLEVLGATSSQMKPLSRLQAALLDLDRGITPAVLKPIKLKGSPPKEYLRRLLEALSVAAVDLFMAGGKLEREAATLVARRLTQHKYTVSKKRDADATGAVINWRKRIDLNPAKERRDNILLALKMEGGTDEAKAERLLAQLPGIVPVKKITNPPS